MRIVLVFVFALAGVQAFSQPVKAVADKIIGVVGDRIILYSDIRNAIADAARNGQPIPENAECFLMEQALVSKVLMLQAEKDSLPVTDEDVEAELDNKVRRFIMMYGSKEVVEEMAGKSIYQIKEDARDAVREQKLAEAMQRKIVDNVRITPNEVINFYNQIPSDSLPYFESELEIGQIVLYPKANRDLEKYVMDELNNYKRQIENKLTTFDQIARRVSMDPGSKDRGGTYELNRNDRSFDPSFMSAAFRIRNEGDIVGPVKTKFGYHLIQLVNRSGDDILIRHILLIPEVTDEEVRQASSRLDSIRARIITGQTSFGAAATRYSEDESAKYAGPYFLNRRDGSPYVTIDELDKDIVTQLDKLKVGEYSHPMPFTDEQGRKGVRIIHYKSRSEPHRLNLRDDYSRIAQLALEQKKAKALEDWLSERIPSYYIFLDKELNNCQMLTRWATASAD